MVREAEQSDLDAILQLYLFLHEDSIPEKDEHLRDTWLQIIQDPNHHLIVNEVDGKIVSSCVCVIIPNLTRNIRPYAFVENVVTREDCRGKGYAGECLEFAREIAEKENCYKMMLLTGSKKPETLRFYEKAGYNSSDKTAFIQWLGMDKAGMKQEGILSELAIELQDTEWPFEFTDHDRMIVRAICFDDDGFFYFVRVERDDVFGKATLIETSGGGVESGEDLQSAIKRELKEELGVEVDIIHRIGVVSDYYNLIHRHNLNNYFLCKIKSFCDKNLTQEEIEEFHLSTLKMTYQEAISEYEKRRETKLGRLIANRELPVLLIAKEMMEREGF